MSNTSREDSLLNKLKSCVGSINKQNNYPQTYKQHHPSLNFKQNYQFPTFNTKMDTHFNQFNHPPPSVPQASWKNRQPLVPYNTSVPHRRNITAGSSYIETQKPEIQYKTKKYLHNEDQSSLTARKYEYGLSYTKKVQPQDRPLQRQFPRDIRTPIPKQSYNQHQTPRQTPMNKNNYNPDLRGQISKRYNLVQNDRPHPTQHYHLNDHEQSTNRQTLVSKTYQQQVLERKQIIQSEIPKQVVKPQKKTLSVQKQKSVGALNSFRREPVNSYRQSPKKAYQRESPMKISVKQQPITVSTKKEKKSSLVRQSLAKAMQEQKNASKGQCSALLKLKKISELNEKINQRIRNIINVFEEHKC